MKDCKCDFDNCLHEVKARVTEENRKEGEWYNMQNDKPEPTEEDRKIAWKILSEEHKWDGSFAQDQQDYIEFMLAIAGAIAAARRQAEEERDAWKEVAIIYGNYETHGGQIASKGEAEEFFDRILKEKKR